MIKYINLSNNTYFVIGLFALFNLFFIVPNLVSMSLPVDDLVVDWRTLQYFFSYRLEFMKRGLMGTVFDILNIQPTLRTIWILSFLASNAVFFLIYCYLRVAFKNLQNPFAWIFIFLLFFTISPATAWHFGYEAGRSDIFNLLIELSLVLIIVFNNKKFHFLIPILLAMGILQHEAFIFMNAPVIMALLFNGFIHKKFSALILISSCVVICSITLIITLYGTISPLSLESLYMSIYHEPLPMDMPANNMFMVVTTSLSTNVLLTLERYLVFDTWKNLMIALPLFASYLYLYIRPVNFYLLSIEKKVLFISPFLIFPMFILGVDIYRWFSIMLINMLIVSVYFISSKIINISEYKAQGVNIALYIIIFYTFFGTLGITTSFPYIEFLIERGGL